MTREERKAAMPKCSKFIDEMRKDFGELVYIKASENGFSVEWGSKLQNGKEAEGVCSLERSQRRSQS